MAHQLLVAVPQHAGVEPYPRLSPHALGGAEAGGGGPAGSHERRLHIHRLPRQRFQPRHHPRRPERTVDAWTSAMTVLQL